MTAVTGCNIRDSEVYWELSGPAPANRIMTCRACKKSIYKGSSVMCREGRKLRFMYHAECFSGEADPRSQEGSRFNDSRNATLHTKTAPNISSLEGPRAAKDSDGRTLSRVVFKEDAPKALGTGKWSVRTRGYNPKQIPSEKNKLKGGGGC